MNNVKENEDWVTHKTMNVQCPSCGEKHYTNEVEFVNIEESPEGWDLYEYVCPTTNEIAKAIVRG